MSKNCLFGLAVIPAILACTVTHREGNPYAAVATIQELMLTQIDPSADALWASVSSISSAAGFEEKRPRSAEEWNALRGNALMLIEATNLLLVPGRGVAVAGGKTGDANLPGIESAANIQTAIDRDRKSFVGLAQGLRATGLKALDAIVRRNSDALFDVGGDIDKACEQCHLKYWYPNP